MSNRHFILCFLFLPFASHGAEDLEAQLYAANRAYVASDFSQVEAALEGLETKHTKLLLCLSYREQYVLYKNKEHGNKSKYLAKILEADLTYDDLGLLLDYSDVASKPAGNKLSVDLMEEVLDKLVSPEQCRGLADLLSHPNASVDARKEILKSIERFCKNVRRYVDGGGRIPTDIMELFTDSGFLGKIVVCLESEELDNDTIDILEYIEEPSLKALEIREPSVITLKAIAAVKKNVQRRNKKFPKSTWFSAYGGDLPER